MSFEMHNRVRGVKSALAPRVTVSLRGALYFNDPFKEIFIKDKEYVVLFFDKSESRIGLGFSLIKTGNSYKVYPKSNRNSTKCWLLDCGEFLKDNNLVPEKSYKIFGAHKSTDLGGLICFDVRIFN